MSEIEFIHQFAYDNGTDPIDHAVAQVVLHIDTRDTIRATRVTNPGAFPIFFGRSLSDEAVARRVIGALLDAGWSPPDVTAKGKTLTEETRS